MNWDVRLLYPHEMQKAEQISSIAFHYVMNNREPPAYLAKDLSWYGAFQDKVMASVIMDWHYSARLDDYIVPLSGIGGVATLPEYRKQGAVRSILTRILEEEYEKETPLSALLPFSYAFYARFGYAQCCEQMEYSLPVQELEIYPGPERVQMVQEGDDLTPFKAIYHRFTQGQNLALLRTDSVWKDILYHNPYKERCYTYLLFRQEEPIAYVVLKAENDHGYHCDIRVRQLAWVDDAAFKSLLGFLGSLSAQYDTLYLILPRLFDFISYIPEAWHVNGRYKHGFCARIVNLPLFLSFLHYPMEKNCFVVEVSDPILAKNNGRFCVSYEQGEAVSVERTNKEADFSTDIGTLVQLCLGYAAPSQRVSQFLVYNPNKKPELLFPKKATAIYDEF